MEEKIHLQFGIIEFPLSIIKMMIHNDEMKLMRIQLNLSSGESFTQKSVIPSDPIFFFHFKWMMIHRN